MTMETKKRIADCCKYLTLILVGIVMIYPLVWMIGASFKSNAEIFSSIGFIPKNPTLEGYQKALSGYGGDIDIWKALLNTYKIVIPKVIFTVCSCTIAAYGFARFKFIGHDFFFALLMSTLFLPNVVLNVPQFIMYNKFGWVDSP
ncbi:MAG TPA: sugar ABC transporter permease, partial [Oribacterium sp.]|nr:sugar ABC transporter permease [Oribacterium sp.]